MCRPWMAPQDASFLTAAVNWLDQHTATATPAAGAASVPNSADMSWPATQLLWELTADMRYSDAITATLKVVSAPMLCNDIGISVQAHSWS